MCTSLTFNLYPLRALLRFIAQSVPAERTSPFFPLLSAHLSCAMTHIETGIQEDALKVLDVLLDHYPALLAARPALLLTNFLELISHRSTGGGARKGQEGKGRSWALSVNPNRNVTGQQWRLTVLFRYSYTCNKLAVSYWCVHIFFWRDLCLCVFQTVAFSSGGS